MDDRSKLPSAEAPTVTLRPNESAPAPAVADTLVGQTLAERYRIEKRIGVGGMGMVYLATHILLDKQVALKVLHRNVAQDPDVAERFVREARAASRIHHEHVIDISDFGTADGLAFFVMELLRGHDVQAVLDETHGRIPWSRSKKIVLQVCAALASAHAAGIVHRDLKPSNIFLVEFLGEADFVKLLDFGIAKQTELAQDEQKLTSTGTVFGTPQYMAPEQARGMTADHRVDIYAMGCLLHQLVTGSVPFSGANFMEVLSKHLTDPVPEIPPEAFDRVGAPGDTDAAQRAVERMIVIHGESTERLASQCEVLLLAGKLGAAREIAEKLLLGNPSARARARYRLGVVAVFEGRFAVAYEALRQAADEATPLGAESELTQVLEALRGLAPVVGQPGDYRRFTKQLAKAQQQFGMYSVATEYQLTMLDRGKTCPAIEPLLASIPEGPRDTFRRYMLRTAAEQQCLPCKDVVHAGLASNEQSAASLLEFGRCAAKEGELGLARDAMRHAVLLSVSFVGPQASPYHAILARFELARVLARLGDRDGARREYEAFLAHWSGADRPVPEIAIARKELAAL